MTQAERDRLVALKKAKKKLITQKHTALRFAYVPEAPAQIALNRGASTRALEVLQMTVPLEMRVQHCTVDALFGALYPVYLRGESHLAAYRAFDAAAEFRKIIACPGIVVSDPVAVLARMQIARAVALTGNRPKARAEYRDFLTLWKLADQIFQSSTKPVSSTQV